MSILIPGKMPNDCPMCPMAYWNAGGAFSGCNIVAGQKFAMDDDGYRNSNKRPDWCPIIELPPHGRLIDADAFLAKLKNDPLFPLVEQYGMSGVIEAQPTIIPADGGEQHG